MRRPVLAEVLVDQDRVSFTSPELDVILVSLVEHCLICFFGPLGEKLNAPVSNDFDVHIWAEPAGLGGCCSNGDLTALCE